MNEVPEVPSNVKCTCGHDSFYHRRADGVCLYKEPGGYQCGCQGFTLINTGSATNLSCGNCKTIRPFSGQPLRCDVCGWQVSEGKWQVAQGKIVPKKKNDTPWITMLVVIGAIVFFVGRYWLDSDTRVVPVHMRADGWVVGEFRNCVSLGTKDDPNGDFRQNVSDIAYLDCDDTTESHDLQVKFTNSSSSGEKKARMWNCQREQSSEGVTSLDCKLEAQ